MTKSARIRQLSQLLFTHLPGFDPHKADWVLKKTNHPALVSCDGRAVGVGASSTPSDWRADKNFVAAVRRALAASDDEPRRKR